MIKSIFDTYLPILLICCLLYSCTSDTPSSIEDLLQKYRIHQENEMNPPAFEKLLAIAECTGPDGNKYETEIHSSEDGYCYFGQQFSDKEPYRALLFNDSTGYLLGDKDSLSVLNDNKGSAVIDDTKSISIKLDITSKL